MASFAPNHVLTGTRWDYRILHPLQAGGTKTSSVFQAEVLPHQGVTSAPKWALIKTTDDERGFSKENLDRELQNYLSPNIASAACFRKLYDAIDVDNKTLVLALEWLDTTLAEVRFQHDKDSYAIIVAFLDAALNNLKNANILLSGINTSKVTAKVGDLGLVFPDASRLKAQPMALRAPEVWLGLPCTNPSQVWAIGAITLCFLRPGILGEHDAPEPRPQTFSIWSIAKVGRLFPEWNPQPPESVTDDQILIPIELARKLLRQPRGGLEKIMPLEEEMEEAKIPPELVDLLRFMFVLEPDQRPSASDVLESKQYEAFKQFVRAMLVGGVKIAEVVNKARGNARIPLIISESGDGYKRLLEAIGDRAKAMAAGKVKAAFEGGKLFDDDDMAKMDQLVVTNMSHQSDTDQNAHYSVHGENASGKKVKGGHVMEDESRQTKAE
ncbi:hypothetical protein DV738_g1631, partial [Chaetothyriales sp. CBS 135597]